MAGPITVASPHRGTPWVDAAPGLIPGISYGLINAILRALWSLTSAPGDARCRPRCASYRPATWLVSSIPEPR